MWGIDNNHKVVGITVTTAERDELRRRIEENINGIEPRLAPSSRYIEFREVLDPSCGGAVPSLLEDRTAPKDSTNASAIALRLPEPWLSYWPLWVCGRFGECRPLVHTARNPAQNRPHTAEPRVL